MQVLIFMDGADRLTTLRDILLTLCIVCLALMSVAQDAQSQPSSSVVPSGPLANTPASPAAPCTPAWSPLSGTKESMRELAAEAENQSDLIFEGEMGPAQLKEGTLDLSGALTTQKQGHYYVIEFNISRVYRGPTRETFTVLTNAMDAPCGFDFDSGKTYLIYADAIAGTPIYVTHGDKPTASIEQSGPALRFLRGDPPRQEDSLDPKAYDEYIHAQSGSVCGHVLAADLKPFAGAVVELWSVNDTAVPPESQYVKSDSDGRFCIKDVIDGKFWLSAEKVDESYDYRFLGYYPTGTDRAQALPVEVAGKSNVSGLQIVLQRQDLYTVTFRIIPAKDKFHSKPAAIIINRKDGDALYSGLGSTIVDDRGISKPILRFAPGRYVISTLFGMPSVATVVGLLADKAKLSMPEQEVEITGSGEVVLRIMPPD